MRVPQRSMGNSLANLDRDWHQFAHAVRERTGVSLTGYKPAQAQRRVRSLMRRSGARGLNEYLSLLDREPGRKRELRTSMAVHVSEFFRSPEQFKRLADEILPKLLAQRPALWVWSAGCSYGAEPYSLALLLDRLAPRERHFILATDLDDVALTRAAAADSFTERDVRNVPVDQRSHFHPSRLSERLALDPAIASRVTFRQHDLANDPSVSPSEADNDHATALPVILSAAKNRYPGGEAQAFDLILCRNVMMYFTEAAKARLFDSLHRALRPGGYLFVGDAEVVNDLSAAGFTQELVGFYRKVMRDGVREVRSRTQDPGLRTQDVA